MNASLITRRPMVELPQVTAVQRALLESGTKILDPIEVERYKKRAYLWMIFREWLKVPLLFTLLPLSLGALLAVNHHGSWLSIVGAAIIGFGVFMTWMIGLITAKGQLCKWETSPRDCFEGFVPASVEMLLVDLDSRLPGIRSSARIEYLVDDPVLFILDQEDSGKRYDLAIWS